MNITSLHSGIGAFNGQLFLLVDNRMLSIEVCTPNFNDYNEFRFSRLTISPEKYNPKGNTVELSPYKIEPFSIDEKELAFLDRWFSHGCEMTEEEINNSPVKELLYSPELLTSVYYEDGYKHLDEAGDYIAKKEPEFYMNPKNWKLQSEITGEPKLYEPGGMHRFLVHVSEAVFSNFYK